MPAAGRSVAAAAAARPAGRLRHERVDACIAGFRVGAWTIPTDAPEADGTLHWHSTTLVCIELQAAGSTGLGATYGDAAIARILHDTLGPLAEGCDAFGNGAIMARARRRLRNTGVPGLGSMALSALDIALWDLKARLLDVSLPDLFGAIHQRLPVYGSGGFTNAEAARLCGQLAGWVEDGVSRVKMKVGADPDADPERVRQARAAVGNAGLMVDANGAYDAKQALALGIGFADCGVDWFEEPLSSDDLAGLALLRQRLPAPLEVAAGEYGWDARYFERMLASGAVDVLQADATRCGGYSGLLDADALCRAHGLPLSTHCAPALHAPAAAGLRSLRHIEWFHDHVRLETMAFDGVAPLRGGELLPDRSAPGHGLSLREADLARWRVS